MNPVVLSISMLVTFPTTLPSSSCCSPLTYSLYLSDESLSHSGRSPDSHTPYRTSVPNESSLYPTKMPQPLFFSSDHDRFRRREPGTHFYKASTFLHLHYLYFAHDPLLHVSPRSPATSELSLAYNEASLFPPSASPTPTPRHL